MVDAITSNQLALCWLLDLQLISGIEYVWSGFGSVVWNGNTYRGIGDLGSVGEISESSDVRATGTTIMLSGINPTSLAESLADIQQGAPVTVRLATFADGAIQAAYAAFAGVVDKPSINLSVETVSIAIALETKMTNLQRPTNRRYTNSDQRYFRPDDIGFVYVETQNDIALIWG
jgi:hypothetical protein